MRLRFRLLLLGSFASIMLGCASHGASIEKRPLAPAAGAPDLFRFRADFWANLHQVLFHESLLPKPGLSGRKSLAHQSVAPVAELTPEESAAWKYAVAYYDEHFTTHSLFADDFLAATRGLTACGDALSLPDGLALATDWRALLVRAAPIYRARLWPEHQRADLAYIDAIRPLVAAHGAFLARRLAAVYETPWPDAPVDVEVTPVVPPFGASTVGEPPFLESHAPLITISSMDPGYSRDSGLEMLFHEASHLLVDKVQGLLDASASRQHRTLPRDLWHFLLFYTAGHVAKERLGPAYVPYAERPEHHLFDGHAAGYLPVFARAWQPYLDGHATLDAAIDAVVASF
jgi:hypothetical protein